MSISTKATIPGPIPFALAQLGGVGLVLACFMGSAPAAAFVWGIVSALQKGQIDVPYAAAMGILALGMFVGFMTMSLTSYMKALKFIENPSQ